MHVAGVRIIPTISTNLPLAPAADAIALVGLFGLARLFISLAAMDIGTSFGTMGARREMLIGFLAEPALLMVFFTASLISSSTSLATTVSHLSNKEFTILPSLAFAGVAFAMVSLAENARVPVDNPATHLELTMIHEALILEYSGRHLALIEWGSALKPFTLTTHSPTWLAVGVTVSNVVNFVQFDAGFASTNAFLLGELIFPRIIAV